jgi:hypothetical protein
LETSTSQLQERHARTSASQASEQAWMESVVNSPSNLHDWLIVWLPERAPAGWLGRTSPEYLAPTTDRPSPSSSPSLQGGLFESPAEDGAPAELSLVTSEDLGSPTECLTLNTLEYPSDAVASSLSDILETGDVPQRYFLSATACRGILRRAENRGKDLPAVLSAALEAVASSKHSGATIPADLSTSPRPSKRTPKDKTSKAKRS